MSEQTYSLDDLLYLMQRLRDPDTGCPWDIKQDYLSITPSTVEEAYEVVDAIEREDYGHLKEELGDLLFQVIFYSQLANEEQRFSFVDIVHSLTEKLVRRHPHVFPDGTLKSRRESGQAADDVAIKASWEAIKESERKEKGSRGVFDDVPSSLPALTRAVKLQKRAAKFGFDWENPRQVIDKLEEELGELKQAFTDADTKGVEDELGDVLFTCANLARHIGREPESLARAASHKFESRFLHVVAAMSEMGEGDPSPEQMEILWGEAKLKLG